MIFWKIKSILSKRSKEQIISTSNGVRNYLKIGKSFSNNNHRLDNFSEQIFSITIEDIARYLIPLK